MNGNFRTIIYILIIALIIFIIYRFVQRGELVGRKETIRQKVEDGATRIKRTVTEEYKKITE
jgi:hypothetical protein